MSRWLIVLLVLGAGATTYAVALVVLFHSCPGRRRSSVRLALDESPRLVAGAGHVPALYRAFVGRERRYTLSAVCQDIARDSDFRWQVMAGLPHMLLVPSRCRFPLGHGLRHGQLLGGSTEHEIFTCLVMEQLLTRATARPQSADCDKLWSAIWELATAILRRYVDQDATTGAFVSRAVPRDPKIRNPFFRKAMVVWGEFYDCDDSAVIVSTLSKLRVCAALCGRHDHPLMREVCRVSHSSSLLDWLADMTKPAAQHLYPRGGSLVGHAEKAFVTYKCEGANDVDPTVNVDVLECLFSMFDKWAIADRVHALRQMHDSMAFLGHTARSGALFTPYLHAFYTLCSFTFMWGRMLKAYRAMADSDRRVADPQGLVDRTDTSIRAYWHSRTDVELDRMSLHDSVLVAMTMPELIPRLRWLRNGVPESIPMDEAGEFFYLVAPMYIAFGCPALTAACLLNLPNAGEQSR